MICDICHIETKEWFFSDRSSGLKKIWKGHRRCVQMHHNTPLMKHLWNDGSKGSIGVGHLNDIKRRKLAGNGEVIRDYGKKYVFMR